MRACVAFKELPCFSPAFRGATGKGRHAVTGRWYIPVSGKSGKSSKVRAQKSLGRGLSAFHQIEVNLSAQALERLEGN